MRKPTMGLTAVLVALPLFLGACAEEPGSVPEVAAEELVAAVPELSAVHEFMSPLWHDAVPAKDFEMMQELIPQFEATLTALDAATLTGILQDKQADWDAGKVNLMDAFQGFKTAAESGNEDEILGYAETFHMGYENLVRLIRPPAPEVDAFHQNLYAVYHYYGPGFDVEKIRTAAAGMAAAIPPLQALELPERLADHQEHFGMVVTELGEAVGALIATLDDPNREEVEAAIDAVHNSYGEIEGIFDGGDTNSHE